MARTAARHAVRAVVALVLLALVGLVVATAAGQVRLLTVLTGSMAPQLPVGTLLVDRPVAPEQVRVGDVITFTRPDGAVVTHRVVGLDRSSGQLLAQTRGDANNVDDDWQVTLDGGPVWVVRASAPGLGALLGPLTGSGLLRVATVVLPLLLAATWLRRIWSTPAPAVTA